MNMDLLVNGAGFFSVDEHIFGSNKLDRFEWESSFYAKLITFNRHFATTSVKMMKTFYFGFSVRRQISSLKRILVERLCVYIKRAYTKSHESKVHMANIMRIRRILADFSEIRNYGENPLGIRAPHNIRMNH